MNLACETEVPIQNENALRFSIVSKPVPLLEYIRTISSLVGASHILAIFEENESLKVFFDDKQYVDALIKKGIHVMGHHVKIDYVIPPGTKIVLSEVDPVITNSDVISILSSYGTVVSPIIRPPISDDVELCHINYGVRYVYMTLRIEIPPIITINYGDQFYSIKSKIDDRPAMIAIPYIKADYSDSCDETATINSYESNPEIFRADNVLPANVLNGNVETSPKLQIASAMSIGHKRRGRPPKHLSLMQKNITSTSVAARKIRKNAKRKKRSFKGFRRRINRVDTKSSEPSVVDENDEIPTLDYAYSVSDDVSENNTNLPFKPVLDMLNLMTFLDEVKNSRNPIDVAKKYLAESFSQDTVNLLCQQLRMYNSSHDNISLRHRVNRLIKSLKNYPEEF